MGACKHSPATARASERARLKYLGHPQPDGTGNDTGTYFSIATRNTLIIVLDVMLYTPTLPRRAEDWTLGEAQRLWLESLLRESPHPWKIVVMHHLVGGVQTGGACYHYGRGSIRATTTGLPSDPFLGEQQSLQELFEETGVDVVLLGHDHVFAAGDVKGTWYVTGGKSAGKSPRWAQGSQAFREQYDFDLDGEPDFLLDIGVVLLETDPLRLRLRYQSSEGTEPGGQTVYELVLPPRARQSRSGLQP